MRKNKILEKLLAIILIFTLTFANFAFVTKSYATSIVQTLFGTISETGHENIEFEAYFGTEDEKDTSVISDVNKEDLAISMHINVKDSGYLKDAKIEIAESEEGKGVNFELKDMEELPDQVQGIEENCIFMQQINKSSEVKFELPIEYKNETYVNENKFTNDALVKFSGIYVDDDGNENEVSRDINLKVSWKDERKVNVETEATKFIDYRNGTILQTIVKVDTQTDNNTLPVKESEITIDVPELLNTYPSNVTVVANNTMGTNGKAADSDSFTENNWFYDVDTNKLNIKVTNEKQLVQVVEHEDEFLKEADEEVIEEERYYNLSGSDEYVITYTYEGVNVSNEQTIVSSNIEAKVTTFSGVEQDDYKNIVTNNNKYDYNLTGKTGDIVSLNIENETKEVSKTYTYANYNDNKYELEFITKTLLNVSYKDIVKALNVSDLENTYVDKAGNIIANNDLYYKQVVISKANFLYILGESGVITISDMAGNVVAVINNDSQEDEEGNIVINFDQKYDRLSFETTAPTGEGNLVIKNIKAMKGTSLDKATFAGLSNITTKSIARADYEYVETRTDVQTQTAVISLLDSTTKATIKMDRDSLSTLAVNDEVELRIELNNAVDTTDMYGHSVYEVTLPEYIENVEVTNVSMIYEEGLQVSGVETEGRVIKVTVDGKQDGINSGVITNGTNIVINANIKVNLYAPAKEDAIILKYSNDEATNYENNGESSVEFRYSAPTGLVAVNSVTNYNLLGSSITSVRQGTQEDLIDIYSDAKVATMEVIVMNNNANTVSNVAILGRIPFEGVKDISTGEELGTTINTRLSGTLIPDVRNTTNFNVYYSENGEATKNLDDESNGWTMNPESMDNVKSYLIIPIDESYEMQESEIVRFTYNYEIPANLSHNEDIYGTFLAYYTNNSEVATTDETTAPDKVGLTTGEGPELEVEISTDKEIVKAEEELWINVKVKNVGVERSDNIVATTPIPAYTRYKAATCDRQDVSIDGQEDKVTVSIPNLEKDEECEYKVVVTASKLPTIAKYYKKTEGFMKREDGVYVIRKYSEDRKSYEDTEITSLPDVKIDLTSSVTAKDLLKEATAEKKQITLKEAEFKIKEYSPDVALITDTQILGTQYDLAATITNCSSKQQNNVVATKVLPQELEYVSAGVQNDAGTVSYDEATRTITWKVDSLKAGGYINVTYSVKAASLPEGVTLSTIDNYTIVKSDTSDTYTSNNLQLHIGKVVITISQTTANTDTYIKEGDVVNYIFSVKNEGGVNARKVNVIDEIPEGLNVRNISYITEGIVNTVKVSSNANASVNLSIAPHSETTVNVEAVARSLNGVQEKTVTNQAKVVVPNMEDQMSNAITHIVESNGKSVAATQLTSSGSSNSYGASSGSNVTKTYKVSGVAWEDSNKDGMRNSGEKTLSGITIKLVESETGVIQRTTTTDSSGNYTFSGIANGNYLVIFDFDTIKYTATAYKKDGVEPNVNSDAIMTQLEQDGKTKNGAISDVITVNDGSISGIDIGLTLADTFDLALDKTISNVTVQTVNDTHVDKYDDAPTFAKTEVAAKYVSGATVYIEYAITVKNVGEVAGYAKKIVDYIPEGMTFNSSLEANADWYTGTDGNLYSQALKDTEIVSGQSKTLRLVLTKQLTEENTGLVNNLAEIIEDYNIYGITDKNSTPGNKAQGENDLGSADVIIGIKTGEVFIHISVIITSMILGGIVIFIAYQKIIVRKKKGGV